MCELLEREWREGEREGLLKGRREGEREGLLKGRKEGELFCLINQTVKKRDRGMAVEEIADALEEDRGMIEQILLAAGEAGSDEAEVIYACL